MGCIFEANFILFKLWIEDRCWLGKDINIISYNSKASNHRYAGQGWLLYLRVTTQLSMSTFWLLSHTLLLYVLIHLSLTVLLNSFGPDETWRTLNFQSSHHQKRKRCFQWYPSPQESHGRGRHPELTDIQVPDLPGSLECSKLWALPLLLSM